MHSYPVDGGAVRAVATHARKLSRFLLQASVVALGVGMNLQQVLHAGISGFLYTALSIRTTAKNREYA
jgi:uncharacterized membrane protein YadS